MLQMFRNFFKSKIGIGVTLGFLAIIAVAFGLGDISSTGTFGGVAGGDRVAVVGERRIDTADLSVRATDMLARVRQQDPTMTMEGFLANDGLQSTLDAIVSRAAIAELAHTFGFRAGPRLVDSEIVNNPNLRGVDGSFDEDAFRNILRQQGISEDLFREDLALGLYANQMLRPITMVPRVPASVARRYAEMRLETRSGRIGALLASAYAPTGNPTDAQLQAFYQENRSDYIRPERRVIRYAIFGEDAFANIPAPTEAQIAARYEEDADEYAEQETRTFTRVVALTQAAAQAIVDEVNGGTSLEASARAKGLSSSTVAATTQEDLSASASAAVANAGFAAAQGALSAPARGSLGWYVLRVDNISNRAGRSLDQVREEIRTQLAEEQRRDAMIEKTVSIEDEFADGRSLSEVAQELGVEVQTTRPTTAAGQIYGTQEGVPQFLAPVLESAFEMSENEPQLAEVVQGQAFIIYDVSQITASAVAPLADIRDELSVAWRADEGMKAAGAAARRVMERVGNGSTLAAAISAEEATLPAPERISVSRQQIEQSGRISRPIALFFSMAEGTTKPLSAEEAGGWFIVQLDEITTPEIAEGSDTVQTTQQQLQPLLPDEYTEQFVNAVEAAVDVEINQAAVDAVRDQLTGANR